MPMHARLSPSSGTTSKRTLAANPSIDGETPANGRAYTTSACWRGFGDSSSATVQIWTPLVALHRHRSRDIDRSPSSHARPWRPFAEARRRCR
jgi:hypothetical protein